MTLFFMIPECLVSALLVAVEAGGALRAGQGAWQGGGVGRELAEAEVAALKQHTNWLTPELKRSHNYWHYWYFGKITSNLHRLSSTAMKGFDEKMSSPGLKERLLRLIGIILTYWSLTHHWWMSLKLILTRSTTPQIFSSLFESKLLLCVERNLGNRLTQISLLSDAAPERERI